MLPGSPYEQRLSAIGFSDLPKLIERGGPGDGQGTITSVYTVLSEHEEGMDPIVEVARAFSTDKLCCRGNLPIRAFTRRSTCADRFRDWPLRCSARMKSRWRLTSGGYGRCMNQPGSIMVGAYEQGTDPELDRAIAIRPMMLEFLRQGGTEACSMEQATAAMAQIVARGQHGH